MYVKQGYAGNKVEFVKEKDEDGKEYVLEYPAGVIRTRTRLRQKVTSGQQRRLKDRIQISCITTLTVWKSFPLIM